jgi:FkbM family methyltransferase
MQSMSVRQSFVFVAKPRKALPSYRHNQSNSSRRAISVFTKRLVRKIARAPKEISALILIVIYRAFFGAVRGSRKLFDAGLINQNRFYDELTKEILRRTLKRDSACIDIGCHNGDVLEQMIRLAPHGRFYAFEPLPDFYDKLTRKYAGDLRVVLSPMALSDVRQSETEFNYVLSNPGYSGLKKRKYDRPDEIDVKINVSTDLLDDIVKKSDHISLIKIDVEGAELGVLRGGISTIQRDMPVIVFEHGIGAADFYGTRPEEVFSLLHGDCGLDISLLDSWLESRPVLSEEAFCDQFYGRKNYYFLAHPKR